MRILPFTEHWIKYYRAATDWNKFYHLPRTGLSTIAAHWNKYFLHQMKGAMVYSNIA
jgi:hypothetical protein